MSQSLIINLFTVIYRDWSVGKESASIQETLVQFLGWEDPLEEGIGYPFQYSCLENSMEESDTTERLSLLTFMEIVIDADITIHIPYIL